LTPVGSSVSYALAYDSGAGDLTLNSTLNPLVAGLAGNIALSQSLIGSIINRPTSPFVAGLALPTDDKCGPGVWGRSTAGKVEADGVTNGTSSSFADTVTPSSIDASYYGAQLNADIGCYQGHFSGWELAFGGFLGFNAGDASQDIFVDTGGGNLVRQSTTKTDFDQQYGGVYMTAVRGNLLADLQIRSETTDYTANNAALNLTDSKYSVSGKTLSGSLSYIHTPQSAANWRLVPLIGFSITENETDTIDFGDGTLVTEDSSSKVVFVSGTAARIKVAEDQRSFSSLFFTGTYYKDLSDPIESQFTFGSGSSLAGETVDLSADSLGDYGELSAGWSFAKIIEQGPGKVAARQFNASVRADARFSSDLDSIGITGQVRWQF